jgi:hypothetical protein
VFLFSAPSADETAAPADTASKLRVRLQQIILRLKQSAVADLVDWTSLLVALPGGPFGTNGSESRVVRALASPMPWVRELAGHVMLRLMKYEPRIGSWPILGGTDFSCDALGAVFLKCAKISHVVFLVESRCKSCLIFQMGMSTPCRCPTCPRRIL